jgi:hypothetical protein
MIKVKNDRVVLTLSKKGKVIKKLDFTNRLTDLYLDYVLSKHTGISYVTDNDGVEVYFSYAYLKFDTTQTITDTSTTMDYDVKSEALFTSDINITVGENSKTMVIDYAFDLSSIPAGSVFTGIGFGRDESVNTDYLLSFIDLSTIGLETMDGVSIGVSRIDEITSNEISTTGAYLPFYAEATDNYGELSKVRIEFEDLSYRDYAVDDLTFTRVYAGQVEVTGFDDYYVGDGLFPIQETTTESDTVTGTTVTLTNSNGQPLTEYSIDGLSTQTGTPTPSSPVAILSSGDEGAITLTDGTNSTPVLIASDGRNLFDNANANILNGFVFSNQTTIVSNADTRLVWIPCLPNTTYTISKIMSARLYVGATTVTPSLGVTLTGTVQGANNSATRTFTTSADANFLCVYYYISTADTLTEAQIRATIQIELGSTATTYEPYNPTLEPLTLDDVGIVMGSLPNGVKDTITDTLFTKRVGKLLLNGTTTWASVAQSTGNADYYYAYSNVLDTLSKDKATIVNEYCDKFKVIANMVSGTVVTVDSLSVQANSSFRLRFMILKSRVDAMTGASLSIKLNAWFTANPTTIYYELATPITYDNTTSVPTLSPETVLTTSNSVQPTLAVKYTIGDTNALYPGDIYPDHDGGIQKAYFIYDMVDNTQQTTYLDLQTKDDTYNGTEVELSLKIERGDY